VAAAAAGGAGGAGGAFVNGDQMFPGISLLYEWTPKRLQRQRRVRKKAGIDLNAGSFARDIEISIFSLSSLALEKRIKRPKKELLWFSFLSVAFSRPSKLPSTNC